MSRRRSDPARDQDVPADPDPEELETYAEIERLMAETGPGGARKIVVFKRRGDGKPPDRCRQFTVQELERLDVIPELFGGGEFTLQLIDSANRYLKRFTVSWPPDLYPVPPAKPTPPAPAAPLSRNPDDRWAELMMLMQQESQRAQERYTALLQGMVTSLVGTIRPPSLKDRVDELAALRGLMPENPKAPLDLVKDAVNMGVQIAQGRAPGGDDKEPGEDWAKVIDKGLDLVGRAVEANARGPRAVPPPGAAGRPGVQVPEHLKPYTWILKYVPYAIGWARNGVPPDRAADAIYRLVPEDHLDVLENFARMVPAERNQLLVQLDGRLAPYQAYLDELASKLVQIFEAEAAEDDERNRPGAPESA